jgi:ribosomal protein S18 acetylase RimI-like enzyme
VAARRGRFVRRLRRTLLRPTLKDEPSARAKSGVIVRSASLEDLDPLTAVEFEAFAGDAYDRIWLRRLLEAEDCVSHVAEVDGSIAGFAITQFLSLGEFALKYGIPLERLPRGREGPTGRIGYFKSIAVRPTHRRRGIGRRLYEERFSLLRQLKIESIFLVQMPTTQVRCFHASMGFSPLGLDAERRYQSGAQGTVWHRFMAA